jgi:beta-glucan synthesis-associated protein KRE6
VNVSINPFFYGSYLGETKAMEPGTPINCVKDIAEQLFRVSLDMSLSLPLFYNVVGRSKKESYQCDAVGSIGNLDESYWKRMHTFRLEWEPGEGGYLRWYYDKKFKFGVDGSALQAKMGTVIPSEPSYVIINTAISTSWGFPATPPGCDEYDCKTDKGRCGFAPGFCHTLPATFRVDSVRIYQNKNNTNHSVGCSPPSFPTKKYIIGNEFKYKRATDKHALKDVMVGTGSCKTDKDCGEGVCSKDHRCHCNPHWGGPHCLVRLSMRSCVFHSFLSLLCVCMC